jgi:replicative DNA helicase
VYKRREAPEFEDDEELKRKAEIIIGKQRNGPTGTAHCIFLGEFSTFANPAEEFREEL